MSKWIKLDDVVLWDNNPNEGDLGALITTVKKIGYIETVNIWQNNEVRAGNHRVKALLELRRQNWQPFGGCVRVNERGEWEIEYIDISDLSPLEANTYGLASNRITRLGYDNQPLAVGLLEEIRIADNELFLATGFDDDDLGALSQSIDYSSRDSNRESVTLDLLMSGVHFNIPIEYRVKLTMFLQPYKGVTMDEKMMTWLDTIAENVPID